jgi:predicted metal-dependent phosphoesterase TrpH
MARVDLHVHSCFSEHPSEWFLKRIGARESYTPIEDVYRQAKSRGMSFVTLTDHNTIDGALQLKSARKMFLSAWRPRHISRKTGVKFMCLFMESMRRSSMK